MMNAKPEIPANIQEFNIIAGGVFAQLYNAFPARINVDREAVARAMSIEGEWNAHQLGSGRSFVAVLSDTLVWLADEDYTHARGSSAGESVTLSVKGLAAMNAIPVGLVQPIGTRLTAASKAQKESGLNQIGDLIGGIIGGTIKSVSSN